MGIDLTYQLPASYNDNSVGGYDMDKRTIDLPRETLEHLYWNERLSIDGIAKRLGLSVTPVLRSMERYNVKRRTPLEIKQIQRGRLGITTEELRDLYIDKQLPLIFISEQLKTSHKTIRRLLQDYQIPIRTKSEVMKISAPKRLRDKNGHGRNWRGGKRYPNGYVAVWQPDHYRTNKQGYVYEHILVWEKAHKQQVPKGWLIHHLNGIKTDNRPENLEAMPNSEHHRLPEPYKERIRILEARIAELENKLSIYTLTN